MDHIFWEVFSSGAATPSSAAGATPPTDAKLLAAPVSATCTADLSAGLNSFLQIHH